MSVRCYHPVFGEITFDDEHPAVQNPDLAERINWLLKPENYGRLVNPDGSQYAPGDDGQFVAVLKYLGIFDGCLSIEFEGHRELPPGATP